MQMLADEGQSREAVAKERERCAKVAFAYAAEKKTKVWRYAAQDIAAAIRAQGDSEG